MMWFHLTLRSFLVIIWICIILVPVFLLVPIIFGFFYRIRSRWSWGPMTICIWRDLDWMFLQKQTSKIGLEEQICTIVCHFVMIIINHVQLVFPLLWWLKITIFLVNHIYICLHGLLFVLRPTSRCCWYGSNCVGHEVCT